MYKAGRRKTFLRTVLLLPEKAVVFACPVNDAIITRTNIKELIRKFKETYLYKT